MSAFSKIRSILPVVAVFIAAASPLSGSWPATPGTTKVYLKKRIIRLPDGSSQAVAIPQDVLRRLQAEPIEDQENFLLLQVPIPNASASPTLLRDLADIIEIREDFDFLQFANLAIDARQVPPPVPAEWQRLARLPPPAHDLFVIQFAAPPRPSWLAELRASGVKVVDYIPQNGYVVLASGDVLDRAVARLPIQLFRLHQPFHKISPAAREAVGPFLNAEIAIAAVPEGTEAESLLQQSSLATIRPAEFIGDRTYHRATLATAVLPQLAALPAVLWIDIYSSPLPSGQREAQLSLGSTLVSDPGGVLQPIPANHRDWIEAKNLGNYKTALKVAILDTGFDAAVFDGVPGDVHPDFKDAAGNSFVEVQRYTNLAGSNADCNGHGTMVAGVLAGNAGGSSLNTDTRDNGPDSNYLMGLGVLPAMPLIVGRVFNVLTSTGVPGCPDPPPPGSTPCFDPQTRSVIYGDPYNRGVRIVSNSWNKEDNPTYTAEAQIHDKIVRSADGTDAGPPTPMVVYFSGGNAEGSPPQFTLVSSPATAKNVISVGGSENFNRSTYTEPPFNPPATGYFDADDGNHHFRVSQIGPTASDNRIKPDLIAPASGIESPLTRADTSSCRLSLVGQVIDAQQEPDGRRHLWSRGTSFAAPLAAGAGVLLYTWFKNTHTGTAPLPSLLKAMQVSFARDLTGPGLGRPPDAKQGWGKTDLTRAFEPAGSYIWGNEEQTITFTGQLIQLPAPGNRYRIKDLMKPVKVTLVWTDAAGTPGAALMPANNLDLTVKFHGVNGSGKQALGNDFNTTGRSNIRTIPDGISDAKNNVEQVVFTYGDVNADQFGVEVFGKAIVADGINVWTGTVPQQNFSLFIENAVVNQNNASFVTQSPPASPIVGGANFSASVTMQNTGDTTWSEANFYRLANLTAPANPFGSRAFLGFGEQIAPNGPAKTFSLSGRAPFAGGSYEFRWQMIEDGVQLFGPAAPSAIVTVTPLQTSFFTLTPCRLLDTRRLPDGPYNGPQIGIDSSRQFAAWGQCGIPSTATAISVNLTVADPSGSGYLIVYPPNIPRPLTSTLNFRAGVTRANNAVVTVDTDGKLEVFSGSTAAHVVLDVNGCFQ